MDKPHQFVTLDALRGVAALAVVAFHSTPLLGHQLFPRGELAVDFFFMLSGFVLTFAYQNRLDAGWSTAAFLKTRLARLYPLYALGLVLGGAYLLLFLPQEYRRTTVQAFAAGLVLCPWPGYFPGATAWIFPLNFPTWSLFYEALANVVHAAFLRRRSLVLLGGAAVAAGSLFCVLRLRVGLPGPTAGSMLPALPRVLFPYGLGMVLFRVWRSGVFRPRIPPFIVGVGLIAALGVRLPVRFEAAYELFALAVLFPVLLLLGASAQPGKRTIGPCRTLGTASYAIYVLHVPVGQWFFTVWWAVLRHRAEREAPWSGLVYMLLVVGMALAADRLYDAPARALLRRVLLV